MPGTRLLGSSPSGSFGFYKRLTAPSLGWASFLKLLSCSTFPILNLQRGLFSIFSVATFLTLVRHVFSRLLHFNSYTPLIACHCSAANIYAPTSRERFLRSTQPANLQPPSPASTDQVSLFAGNIFYQLEKYSRRVSFETYFACSPYLRKQPSAFQNTSDTQKRLVDSTRRCRF